MNFLLRKIFILLILFFNSPLHGNYFYTLEKIHPLKDRIWPTTGIGCSPVSDKNGNVYFQESLYENNIYKYNKSGFFINKTSSNINGQLAIDSLDNIYAVNSDIFGEGGSITKTSSKGNLVKKINIKDIIELNNFSISGAIFAGKNNDIHVMAYNESPIYSGSSILVFSYNLKLKKIIKINSNIGDGYNASMFFDDNEYYIYSNNDIHKFSEIDGYKLLVSDTNNYLENKRVKFTLNSKNKEIVLSLISKVDEDNGFFYPEIIIYDYFGKIIATYRYKIKANDAYKTNCSYTPASWFDKDKYELIIPFPTFNIILFINSINYKLTNIWGSTDSPIITDIRSTGSNLYSLRFNEKSATIYKKNDFSIISKIYFNDYPTSSTEDKNGNIYIIFPSNKKIEKISSTGKKLKTWYIENILHELELNDINVGYSIAYSNNIIYVSVNSRILSLDLDGKFIKLFDFIPNFLNSNYYGIAADSEGNIYATKDSYQLNDDASILKYSTTGDYAFPKFLNILNQYVKIWSPRGITFDHEDTLFVSEVRSVFSEKDRVLIFNKNHILTHTIGSTGSLATQLSQPVSITTDDQRLYIADTGNHRIVIYKKVDRPDNSKAIIIAGGTTPSDPLWDEVQANAHHAFHALASQGYTKENIYYLNANTEIDLDNNGKSDDVDATPTLENIRKSITEWAASGEDVVIYMIDHGGDKTYQLNAQQFPISIKIQYNQLLIIIAFVLFYN